MKVNHIQGYSLLMLFIVVSLVLIGCESGEVALEEKEMSLSLTSNAFRERENIPADYTCQGQGISPPLSWSKPPEGTQSFALIMDDPDSSGGTFTHWVIFNIPADAGGLPEGLPAQSQLPSGALQGKNDFG